MFRFLSVVIALVSVLVPRQRRSAWQEEWRNELRGISHEHGRGAALQFAGGIVRDALALRSAPRPHEEGPRYMTMRMPWMDFKLGLRMLLRSPGITLVGVFGMAVAIAIAAGAFTMIGRQLNPTLPLADGDRIVSIQAWDAAVNGPDGRILHDFLMWRDELQSVKDVGAFRDVSSNVISQGRAPEPVQVAEMTAAGFRVAAVSPLLGRYLSDEDERPAAPRVLVIGAAVWRDRFGSDPAILGTSVQLNDTHHTIVGIMPDGFAFPVNHGWWVPLRVDAARVAPREGPAINVFARLSDGETIRTAQAELTGVGGRISAASPATHQHIRPRQ